MSTSTLDQEIIGLAIADPRGLRDLIAARIRPEHFANPVAGEVWGIIQALDAEGSIVDARTVLARKGDASKLTRQQITEIWLGDCLVSAPLGNVGSDYARLLKDQAAKNQIASALQRGQQMLEGGVTARDMRLELLASLQEDPESNQRIVTLGQAMDEVIAGFDQINRSIPTPWRQLNTIIGGWVPGYLYVVGGRPSVGKSIFMQNAAMSMANSGVTVFESVEMDRRQVTMRAFAAMTEVYTRHMGGKRADGSDPLRAEDRAKIIQARDQYGHLPLLFPQGTQTVVDIRENARAARVRGPLAGIVVDYLQLLQPGKRIDSREQEVAFMTRQLKLMAGEFDCPVILGSQLNRAAVGKPTLAHLRESGAIEQDADVVILLDRDDDNPNGAGDLEVDAIVAKQRQGMLATAHFTRNGPTLTFFENDSRSEDIH